MKKLQLFALTTFLGCALLAGCSSGSSKSTGSDSQMAFDSVAAKKDVDAGNALVIESVARGDSAAAASCYTADAKFMGAHMPAVSGRKNIQAVFSGLIKAGITKLTITTTGLWGGDGILAEEGTFKLAMKDGRPVDNGKYVVLWKMEDGKWKIFRDCSNSDQPLPGSK